MAPRQSIDPDELDRLLTVLADQYCRSVIFHFRNSSESVATVAGLAREVRREVEADLGAIAVQLHHSALPRLDDVGIVEYDARSNTVRYLDGVAPRVLLEEVETLSRRPGP
ncbi:DUF7344 domain-containing protein [Halopelagius longus]|nr:hypothetical protein [Halopelagius longus]SDQ18608.1 hypothetical protein SAMN05216278_0841 [Halopelagius longus]